MKKLFALSMMVLLVLTLVGCSSENPTGETNEESGVKIGIILVGDANEGYSVAHINGIKEAMAATGLTDDNIIWKYNVAENQTCADEAIDLVEKGCSLVIANSYSHQSFIESVAKDYPEVTFVNDTGDSAALSGLANFKNAYSAIYQARYVSGVVAGMKLAELEKDGKLTAENYDEEGKVKIGYIGAFPYAEIVSGYTAFLLGVRSVYPNVNMYVKYTNDWGNLTAEAETANEFIAQGCVIIGQHSDTTGGPSAVQAAFEEGKLCYSVGYNVSMLSVAPDVALTSAANDWSKFYEFAFNCAINGEEIPTDWCGGYNENCVYITELGSACAEGTAEKVAEVEAGIKDGSIKVFDINTFTIGGEAVSDNSQCVDGYYVASIPGNAIHDGCFNESEFRCAPYFAGRIDGVFEQN